MRIGLMVAMDKEASLVCGAFQQVVDGGSIMGCIYRTVNISDGVDAVVLRCGVGKTNAAVGAMLLRGTFNVDVIISTGVAGATKPYIRQGMIVAGSSYSYHDVYCGKESPVGVIQGEPSKFEADTKLLDILCGSFPDVSTGRFVSGDKFVDTKMEIGRILDLCPSAIAVDMESASIAQVCNKPLKGATTPFVSIRIISDCLLDDTASDYDDFWKSAPAESSSMAIGFVKKVSEMYKIS